jgi:hypothetical protein
MVASPTFIVNLNLAISWGLLVLIWMVQLIIYPGFQRIPPNEFSAYHRWYVKRISSVVIPLMLAELLMTVWWLKSESGSSVPTISAFLVFIVWLSTFAIQVPIHIRLKNSKDEFLIRRLVVSNWIRTLAWSTKAAVITVAVITPGS